MPVEYSLNHDICRKKYAVFLHKHGRQIMNIHKMTNPYIANAKGANNELISLAGIDLETSRLAEIFSHFTLPEYRRQNIHSHCLYLCCRFAALCGHQRCFTRVSSADDSKEYFLKKLKGSLLKDTSGITTHFCKECDFFGNKCQHQWFIELELSSVISFCLNIIYNDHDKLILDSIITETINQESR